MTDSAVCTPSYWSRVVDQVFADAAKRGWLCKPVEEIHSTWDPVAKRIVSELPMRLQRIYGLLDGNDPACAPRPIVSVSDLTAIVHKTAGPHWAVEVWTL